MNVLQILGRFKGLSWLFGLGLGLVPALVTADDIDIFVGSSAGTSANPNVLIVLDNTSNWARQSQKWPEAEQQGQSEVSAIQTVIQSLNSQTNVGLMEFVTGSDANNNGGFIRYAVQPMTDANQTVFGNALTTIYNNITNPDEKRNSNTPYGNLMYDVYNYFAGANQSQAGAATNASLADVNGYTTTYSSFRSPVSCATSCAKNFIIFISNPDASGPSSDDATNTSALAAQGGNTTQLGLPNFTTASAVASTNIGTTSQCITPSACAAASDTASNNAAFIAANAPSLVTPCADTSRYSSGCSCGSEQPPSSSCPTGTQRYSVIQTIPADAIVSQWTTNDSYPAVTPFPGTTAPSGFPTTNGSKKETSSCPAGTHNYFAVRIANGTHGGTPVYNYTVQCKQTATANNTLGYTTACYASQAGCATGDYAVQCASPYSCACNTPTTTSGASCATGTARYSVLGNNTVITNTPTGTYTSDNHPYNADEWSRLLYQKGVPISGCSNQMVTTYAVDVYNAQPNAQNTALMLSMARNGGGKYFNATNKSALINALKQIFVEIQSVNSTFASASLPINATNRAQNANQVFIGMFRPDPDAKPRWFGNVKRYQLNTDQGGNIQLADINGNPAVNFNTGFIADCATSWWTSDSGSYWSAYTINPNPASTCTTSAFNAYSDSPDGPRVEKGAVAEALRKGNNPPGTDTSPTWNVLRTAYTASGTSLQTFNTANTGLSSTLVNWVLGQDTQDENANGNLTETRASIHGDVVHSRPLPVNYCTTANCSNIVVYFGANDGSLRAVDAATGKEKWAFFAPEFNNYLDRLRTQSPLVSYPGANFPEDLSPAPTRRNYFFDGSIGIYQNADNSRVWIYPTMRRGGRMLYALDVTNPASPSIKWKFGCPNLSDDSNCTAGATGIGQTWSIPNVALVKGYSTSTPVVVVGGGYDSCEDADTASPSCSSGKGHAVYVMDADTGAVLATLPTLRSVAADAALIDIDFDGYVDYAYIADTGGNLYRINLSSYVSATRMTTPLDSDHWTISRIAYTTGAGRKFLFSPSLFGAKGIVYAALGSGDREHPLQSNYPYTTPVTNRFYVYRECLPSPAPATSSLTSGDDLDDTALMNAFTATNPAPCAASQTLASNCASNKGWFVNLNNGTGEQTVTSAVISGGMVTFSTNRPIPAATGTCASALGEARGYWLDLFKGSGAIETSTNATCGGVASKAFVGGGFPPSPIIGTVSVNGVPVTVIIGAIQKSGTVSSAISPQKASATNLPARRRVYTIIKGEN